MNDYSSEADVDRSTKPILRIDSPTVFYVDVDEGVRDSLDQLLEAIGLPLRTFPSGEAFLRAYDGSPGCLITDIRTPSGLAGIELQSRLARSPISLPLIITASVEDASLAVRAMQNRAVTLIEKPYRDHELIEAIQSSLRIDRMHRQQDMRTREVFTRLATLSPNETEVLELIIEGVTNKVIANRLDVSIRTIENRRKRIYEKMRTESVAVLVRMVVEARIRTGQAVERS
ncbi:Transcriptional regulatory protein TdiR [Rosistilla oblonga]|uniref:Transcriptional regulatory protein TdiR n=1 Tax=Rosistilla oblonga TaxID=2527990 RepID=A0A518IZ11_9BACT|nr:LuxR C-terminal-related transcriptional regulator [Rosistilla oblonga]QDV13488.1 Transcriptional regulatory protein TdiR [Rosistilla oblonga]QDV58320.1 Transcriptional regulatory protein TdiR [Rosistilla oblonga]